MAYGNYDFKSKGVFFRIKSKFLRWLVANFPLNYIRVIALRKLGFNIGKQVYIGPSFLLADTNTDKLTNLQIGDRVAIGPRVTIILASDANWSILNNYFSPVRGKVVLNNDCWLGAGVIILPNITIGECSVVGAGSVVTKDVAPYTVVAGNPAKIIKTLEKK